MIRPEKLDPGTSIKGLDYIDVAGNSKRDYKLTFYAHREGITQLKVLKFCFVVIWACRPVMIAFVVVRGLFYFHLFGVKVPKNLPVP